MYRLRYCKDRPILKIFCSPVNQRGTHHAQTLRNFNSACMMMYAVPCEQPTACAVIDGHTMVITNGLFHILHYGFSWHLCRTTRMLPISDALSSLVKLLDPIEHNFPWETVNTRDASHDALLWTVLWPTKTTQLHAVLLVYTGCHWLIVYLSDRTQSLRQAYICRHLLTYNERIMYKWYQGNGHLWLIYWLALASQ